MIEASFFFFWPRWIGYAVWRINSARC